MSRTSEHHEKLDENGEGKCSAPVWCMGSPSGFCDKPAYGERPEPEYYWCDAYSGERRRSDGKYDGYVPGLACPNHGGPRSRVFKDGSAWCAVLPDFVNTQESPCGFGDTPEEARANLEKAVAHA